MDARRYLELFLTEAREHLEQIGRAARDLGPASAPELIHDLFRSFHSLKGMSASMEFNRLAELAHGVEDLYDQVRQGRRTVDSGLVELTLDAADRMQAMVEEIAAAGQPSAGAQDLLARARDLALRPAAVQGPPAGVPPEPPVPAPSGAAEPAAPLKEAAPEPAAPSSTGTRLSVWFEVATNAPLPAARALVALKRLQTLGEVLRCEPNPAGWAETGLSGRVSVELRSANDAALITREIEALPDIGACRAGPADAPAHAPAAAPRPGSATVRVRTDILDSLMDGVGEILVAAGVIEERLPKAPGNDQAVQRLRRAISRLHDDVLEMRMVPFDWIAQRFHQSVRNLAHNLGKSAALDILGADVHMDRAMLEELVDPINHMLRNAIDHGLEPPEERQRAGKAPAGRIELALERDSDVVRIRLSDDGRGMDPARIREAAVRKGFATEEQVRALEEEEVLLLTTIPGFSTADRLTEVSGRGVGMDVVRTRIESLGGHMRIESHLGRGTTIHMSLPLTVAVIDSLLLRLGPELYAVPIQSVKQTVEVDPRQVQYAGGGALLQWGGLSVHLRALRVLLGEADEDDWSQRSCAVLFEDSGRTFGLAVDAVVGKRPIVVKRLLSPLENLREYSGATVLENGRIALILDLANLARA